MKQAPTIDKEFTGTSLEREVYTHPAFGTVRVVKTTSSVGEALYGSTIKHRDYLTISIHRSNMFRGLHSDTTNETETLMEFCMSEFQWAQFISSMGNGSGVPITLKLATNGEVQEIPGITHEKTLHGKFSEEIEAEAAGYVQDAKEAVAEIDAMLASKSAISKAQLRSLRTKLSTLATGLPNNMAFIMDQFKESMEQATNDAKAQINAHVSRLVQDTGIEQLRKLGNGNGTAQKRIKRAR